MTGWRAVIVTSVLLLSSTAELVRAERDWHLLARQEPRSGHVAAPRVERDNEVPITVRPGTLADLVDTLAGGPIRLVNARVVGVFDPEVFLVESQTRLRPMLARNRVLVFIEAGTLRVEPARLVAETVTVSGVARTLLGMHTSAEVRWPAALTRETVERLEIRAAVLARSVKTPDGVDLLVRSSSRSTPASSSPFR